ncbi:MAG TPA: Crp/Fnr family transcriptional regulator [Alphaproteobacteria bacterium]
MAKPNSRTVLKSQLASPCSACPVRDWALCQALPEGDLAVVERFMTGHRTLSPGTDFYHQGEPSEELFTVLEGWGFQYRLLEDGRRQIVRVLLPGDFVGFQPDLFAPVAHSAQALTEMRLCIFPRQNLLDLFRDQPQLALRLTWMLARDDSRAQDWLVNVGRRSARERVAHLLLELYYRVRMRAEEPLGSSIPLPLTQEHIGDALGLTSVHVNRTLRDLRQSGLLVVSNRVLNIVDPDGLAEVAGFDSETLQYLQP